MELARSEAMLFKFGSGTGTDLSTLRSHREKLSGGGKPSGPLSFMRVYDQIAAVVKSGGKTRRAAKMQSLKDLASRHPGVHRVQVQRGEEGPRADRARATIRKRPTSSVLFQNANLSVRVTDEFMQAVEADKPWTTHWVTDPNKRRPDAIRPAKCCSEMAESAWCCGDPGVQYDTTINRWHTCPNSGRINASNPCSRVHVPRRLGLQPGEHQPDEVPPRRRHVRRRAVHGGLPAGLHRPGNPGRSRQLSDEADRREQPSLPPARAGLLEPGQPDDGRRPALRLGRGPRAVRRDHGAAARRGQSAPAPSWPRRSARSTASRRTASRCCA